MNSVYPEEENIILLDNYYTNVKQISEDYLKYITNYKIATGEYLKKLLLNQEKFRPRLIEPVDQPKHINIGHLISIASIVPKVIDQQIINIEYFVEGIESKFDKFEKLLKEKSTEFIDIENSYKDIKNELNKKYREIDKLKANYMANINMAEETIHKFYMKQNSKKKSNTKLNFSQMDLNDSTSGNFEEQVNLSIQKTKRIEEEYKANIFSVKTLEKKYIETAEASKESLISILCAFSNNLKDLISDCMVFLRNSFKIPLSEIDMYLSELVNLDEFSKFKKDIISSYKNNSNLKPIYPEKYTLKIFQGKNNNTNTNKGIHKSNSQSNSKRKNSCMQSEEELQELDFIQEEEIFMTIKKMMENFELLDNNNYDLTLEEEKLRCKYLTLKILSFAPISKMYSNKIPSITEEEVNEIDDMLKKGQNRVIFIQKLSQFRTRGIFEIPEREFNILSRLFNSIVKTVESDMDYDCAINIIILSQTYYLLKNNNKEYLQNAIMNNELFKKKQFWETFAQYSIEKEIAQNKETDSKNGENLNGKEYEEKCKNIVFSQLFPITNNMIDFGLDINIVEEIVVPLIDQYKISPELAEAVLSTINMKK
jgi:hypothetical protein